jgi:hypothetical protein
MAQGVGPEFKPQHGKKLNLSKFFCINLSLSKKKKRSFYFQL